MRLFCRFTEDVKVEIVPRYYRDRSSETAPSAASSNLARGAKAHVTRLRIF